LDARSPPGAMADGGCRAMGRRRGAEQRGWTGCRLRWGYNFCLRHRRPHYEVDGRRRRRRSRLDPVVSPSMWEEKARLNTYLGKCPLLRLGIGGDSVDGRCADGRPMKSRSPPSQMSADGSRGGTPSARTASGAVRGRRLLQSSGGFLRGDRGRSQGEGGDAGMAHTSSTRSIGAAVGRGRGLEEVAAAPVRRRRSQSARCGGGQKEKAEGKEEERAEGGRQTCA
jgi:hypothetical protein